jgi:hypothetical protein
MTATEGDPMTTYDNLDELEAARRHERAVAGEPHGLSADEVTAARRGGMDLARYAALKAVPRSTGGGRSLQDIQAILRPSEGEVA